MPIFALVKDGVFTGKVRELPEAMQLPGKPTWSWLPYIVTPPPVIDPATEILGPPEFAVDPDVSVTKTTPSRQKTTEELAADDRAVQNAKVGDLGTAIRTIVGQIDSDPTSKTPEMAALIAAMKL